MAIPPRVVVYQANETLNPRALIGSLRDVVLVSKRILREA